MFFCNIFYKTRAILMSGVCPLRIWFSPVPHFWENGSIYPPLEQRTRTIGSVINNSAMYFIRFCWNLVDWCAPGLGMIAENDWRGGRPQVEVHCYLLPFLHHVQEKRDYSGEAGNVYIILKQIYSGNGYQISSKLPELCKRYYGYKNILVYFFWTL